MQESRNKGGAEVTGGGHDAGSRLHSLGVVPLCLRALSGLFVFVCVVLSTRGTEDVIPFYRQSQTTELRSPLDAVQLDTFPESKGIQFAHFKLNPYATEDSTYTDNPTRSEHNKMDDVLQEYAVGFNSAFRPHECVKLTLNYEFGWHDYMLNTARDYLSHQAGFNATLDRVGVRGLSLSFFEQYLQTANTSALENEIAQFSKYQTDRAGTRAVYNFNRFKISGEYAYALLSYYDRINRRSNFRTHTGSFESSWDWLPKRLEIFESFQLQRTLFDRNGVADFDGYTLQAGVRGSYSRLTYSVATGYAFAVPLYRAGTQGDSSVTASIGYVPTRRLSFDVNMVRTFVPDVRTGATLETDLNAALKFVLTHRGRLALTYARNEADRLIGAQQISVAYSTRFDYKITRNAAAIFNVTRYDRSSTLPNDNFNANEVRLGLRLAW